jgi:acyl carrier protein
LRQRLTRLAPPAAATAVLDLVRQHIADVLGHGSTQAVDDRSGLLDLGFDSLTAVELRNRLSAATGLRLASTVTFDYPTPGDLAEHLRERLTDSDGSVVSARRSQPVLSSLDRITENLGELKENQEARKIVVRRLRDLLGQLDLTAGPVDDREPPGGALDGASDDELFELIDREFGVS